MRKRQSGEEEHRQVETHVPTDALGRQDVERLFDAVHHGIGGGVGVDAALEGQHERHQGVEEVHPGQPLGAEAIADLLLVGVHDRAGPEPGGEDDLDQVLGVAQVDVDRRQEDRDGRGQDDARDEGEDHHGQEFQVGRRVQGDHEDDQHDHLEEEEDAGRSHCRQGEDLAGERDLLHDAGVVHHDARAGEHTEREEVPQQQPGEEEDDEVRHLVAEHDLEHDVVDGQRHGRGDHRPHQPEHRALVLDLDLGADQVDQQLAGEPDLAQPLAHTDGGGDDAGARRPPGGALAQAGRPGCHRRSVRHPLLGGLLDSLVCVRRGGRNVQSHVYAFPAAAVAAERSMTLSMKPYSQASSAVNQRSRSESVSIRSSGCPVWKAMRSAIIRLR